MGAELLCLHPPLAAHPDLKSPNLLVDANWVAKVGSRAAAGCMHQLNGLGLLRRKGGSRGKTLAGGFWRGYCQSVTSVLCSPSLPQVTGEAERLMERLIAGLGGWAALLSPLRVAGGCHRACQLPLGAAALWLGALCPVPPWQHDALSCAALDTPPTPPVRPS